MRELANSRLAELFQRYSDEALESEEHKELNLLLDYKVQDSLTLRLE